MQRRAFLMVAAALVAASCGPSTSTPALGPDGKPLPRAYKISPGTAAKIEYRMLDSVNALRQAKGVPPLALNAKLNAAAATHARDMSVQNRPWHFGSDGSSPIDRVQRVGYTGRLVGENISETYETELETLAAWMEDEPTRNVILDASARDLGFAWYQEDNGKIWWTLVTGAPDMAPIPGLGATAAPS
ncbi:CAP domain-containing protein [Salipiger sp. P9]|uniref:CAP domain-containing protein n=1 Tax=Salipiger pentaromativorans TaxID=2943193 RepID=UPI0021581017|nr:CAP domain-containing protein [Salipiger pentaromativorans]MCR8549574.1 CAP domain-containing protein [Salipiger pentaromativorans]